MVRNVFNDCISQPPKGSNEIAVTGMTVKQHFFIIKEDSLIVKLTI